MKLGNLDNIIIYVLLLAILVVPQIFKIRLDPVQLKAADDVFAKIDALKPEPGQIVFIAADWGPGTSAENKPQTAVVIEHLFRKKIPFALTSLYPQAAPLLKTLPLEVVEQLKRKGVDGSWEYGKDWVNLGYLVGGGLSIQSMSRADDIKTVLKNDAYGTPLKDIPVFKDIKSVKDIPMLVEITGLVGVFNAWLQFFQSDTYRPILIHGCTSISTPDAYIYYSSKQIGGFFEGVAGAAWYDALLNRAYPGREEVATGINTGIACAQLFVLALMLVGNASYLIERYSQRSQLGGQPGGER
jgi:hypothetical protein